MTLDQQPLDQPVRIVAVDWDKLVPEEARRLKALGIDAGALVSLAQRGVFGGSDPIAIRVGRMVVAVRRAHAQTIGVEPVEAGAENGTAHAFTTDATGQGGHFEEREKIKA